MINRILHRLAPGHLRRYACHLSRDAATLPGLAGLRVIDSRRYVFGVLALIEAVPPAPGS
jgi:methyltransferase OMS1